MPSQVRRHNPKLPAKLDVQESITQWLRDYIKRTGFKQNKVAYDLGISEPQLSNMLDGSERPGFKTLIGLEFGVGADLAEVMRWPTSASQAPQARKLADGAKK